MFSPSLPSTSPSSVNDPAQAWDTTADAVTSVTTGPLTGGQSSAAIQACGREIEQAGHLSSSTKHGALQLLSTLATQGCVAIAEGAEPRKAAVAVQWAMERTLPGTEVIMTPDRPTPFRKYGQTDIDEAQLARAHALMDRYKRMDPLYLVFCHEGPASLEEDPIYSRDILKPAQRDNLPLFEVWLGGSKSHFPSALSGAFILSPQGPEPAIFAIRAAQVDKTRAGAALTLWWAQARSASGETGTAAPSTVGDTRKAAAEQIHPHISPAFNNTLDDWTSYLQNQTLQPITRVLGRDAALLDRR